MISPSTFFFFFKSNQIKNLHFQKLDAQSDALEMRSYCVEFFLPVDGGGLPFINDGLLCNNYVVGLFIIELPCNERMKEWMQETL